MIGIDQSYADSGICVAIDRRVRIVNECKTTQSMSNTEKRAKLQKILTKCFASCCKKSTEFESCEVICIIERIRLQSAKPGSEHFLNLNYIKGIGALNALIVDTASKFNIPVYSVDTRSWKSQVVGTSKPREIGHGIPPEKWPTIEYCIGLGLKDQISYPVSNKKKHYFVAPDGTRYTFNDNKADSIGIALYGFLPPVNQKLEEEH